MIKVRYFSYSALGTSVVRKGQMMISGLTKAAAEIMTSSERAYSMLTLCEPESAKKSRWESELCAVHKKRIFISMDAVLKRSDAWNREAD